MATPQNGSSDHQGVQMTTYAAGTLVRARDREWVVQAGSTEDFLVLRPMGGGSADETGVFPALETVEPATFAPPTVSDLGDHASARLLRDALRIGFRSSAGPFRSLASLAVEPRSYQYVPLLMALRQDTVRLLISDDVGIGKTVEAGLIAAELLATGQARGLSVLCSPALAEQWADELRDKFGLDATLVLPSTATRLQRGLGLDESIFGRYPVTVVSTDFIKSPVRRDEYVRAAPDLLIVDEAHTAVSDGTGQGGGKGRTQRHELLRRLAADRQRHLLLVTATPHSGQDTGFRNLLELLDEPLAYIDLDQQQDRALLARYFVQRRRGDIRRYLDQDTPFPRDRESQERPYKLDPAYRDLFDDVLEYARSSVLDEDGQTVRQRVRWWSALALLRSLASSPAAAAATLRTRATNAAAVSPDEADTLGRASVLDLADDEAIESMDTTPGALTTDEEQTPERRKLLTFARAAEALQGTKSDVKLKELFKSVDGLLREGYHPIVFCRYIPTAEYVGEHLTAHLGKRARCAVVTGTLPPAERVARIAELTDEPGPVVLVATDCLSEGVNLQESFDAVLHYDLAWNPTRHEQREGRVDRFGQSRDVVRAVTLYGTDNQIDGLVLEILLRKHNAIRRATGVSVPVPDTSDNVMNAVLEGLLLRGRDYNPEQLILDGLAEPAREALDEAWTSAAEKEKASRTRYAQEGIKPDEVAREVDEVRAALGDAADIETFVYSTMAALGSTVNPTDKALIASTTPLPRALAESLTPGHREPLPFHREPPSPAKEAVLARTDPDVEALARYVLDAALDPEALPDDLSRRLARRAGVFRSGAVETRTSVLLLRYRMNLTLPGRDATTTQVVEHAEIVAYSGNGSSPQWLPPDQAATIFTASAASIGAGPLAEQSLQRTLDDLPALAAQLDLFASQQAQQVLESHRRVRKASGDRLRGLAVEPILPVDVLGTWVYLPEASA